MVTTFYPPYHFGGDAIFVQALARALVSEGHHVEVVHCEDAYRLRGRKQTAEQAEQDGVVVHRLRNPFGMLSPMITQQLGMPGVKAAQLRTLLGSEYDVVNFHNISLIGGPGVLQMSRAPVTLYTLHEHWLVCPMHIFWKNNQRACDSPQCIRCCIRSRVPPQFWRYTRLIERSLANVDALLAPSTYTAERHKNLLQTPPIHVLPTFSGLDPTLDGNPLSQNRKCFLYVGRVTASKGIANLLKEFVGFSEYDLVVVGGGDLLLTLQRQYAEHRHIQFLGHLSQEQLGPWYQKATALVLPSLAPEVFPLTILEAFAHGTPAIVHHAGGSREAVDKTGGGVVYHSPEELHDAVTLLGKNFQLCKNLGQRARLGYEQWYSQKKYLERYLQLIQEIGKEKFLTWQEAPIYEQR
ncbi:glycosyltransferase family 4 protein [Candidatus Nitrospira allomarina]|uniref:Glycosyltransferase family 4 protein n=1 Tax=Candidatus Nitrospira allomarina TaxID=3020900 RepID=A0AA96GF83_9BACT|nr:glycosyltransferase family 4 protein [Candidatus Nitrospira allomarina]WNM58955.1 glycosyltransferase family 4 protein [Candidatus Nitrospira allomarina]